jgi:hypothetical protein
MKRLVLILACLGAAIGCVKPAANPVVVRELIPVPCPPPAIPARPALPSAQLGPDPALRDLLRALLADREALAAWALDLEIRLRAYLPPEPPKEPK